MEPKMKWFRRGKYAVGVDVNSKDFAGEVLELRDRGYHEVEVRERQTSLAYRLGNVLGAVLGGGLIVLAVVAVVAGVVAIVKAVLL